MEVLTSNKGGMKLNHGDYLYTKHSTRKTSIWWKCVKRSSGNCRGSLKTDLQRLNPEVGQPHNHAPDQHQVRLAQVRMTMKRQAADTRDKPGQIYAQAVSQCSDEVKTLMPLPASCKRTIRNQRPAPPAPRRLADLGDLPQDFTMTVGPDPGQFLICDNGPNRADRLLVFARAAGLWLLAAVETFYMDGNFAMSPNIFCQIYVIRVLLGNSPVTVVYALLPAKTRASYERLFQAVVDKCVELDLELNVQTVVTDFEDAVLRAAVAVFEGMAFLRINLPQDPPEVKDLLNYFDQTHVSGRYRPIQQQPAGDGAAAAPIRMRRIPPLFAPAIWNVHNATIDNNPRTNNICEGWNNKFMNLVGHYHPSIWRTIEWFQKEEATVRTIMQQDAVGNPPAKQVQRRYVQMQERLRNLCIERRDGRKSVEELLRGVSWNIRLNRET
ncbi:hypothetical protein ACOMHN_019893 [Nucella lapillus]